MPLSCSLRTSQDRWAPRLVAVHAQSDVVEGVVEGERGLLRCHDARAELAEQGGAVLAEEVQAVAALRPSMAVRSLLVHDTALRALLRQAGDARPWSSDTADSAQGMGLGPTNRGPGEFVSCPVVAPPVPAQLAAAACTTGAAR